MHSSRGVCWPIIDLMASDLVACGLAAWPRRSIIGAEVYIRCGSRLSDRRRLPNARWKFFTRGARKSSTSSLRPTRPAGARDPLKGKALGLGIPFSQPPTFKSDEAFEQFRALGAELLVMAFVTVIVPERILYLPRYKSICFHPSLLPRHRGASAINWTSSWATRMPG